MDLTILEYDGVKYPIRRIPIRSPKWSFKTELVVGDAYLVVEKNTILTLDEYSISRKDRATVRAISQIDRFAQMHDLLSLSDAQLYQKIQMSGFDSFDLLNARGLQFFGQIIKMSGCQYQPPAQSQLSLREKQSQILAQLEKNQKNLLIEFHLEDPDCSRTCIKKIAAWDIWLNQKRRQILFVGVCRAAAEIFLQNFCAEEAKLQLYDCNHELWLYDNVGCECFLDVKY